MSINTSGGLAYSNKTNSIASTTSWSILYGAFQAQIPPDPGTSYLLPYVAITGASGNTVNIDNCRTYKITAAEYAALDGMTAAQIAAMYPYVDDVKHVNAVYVNNPGKNLLPPFTEWQLHANSVVTEPYKLTLNSTAANQTSEIIIPVSGSTTYTPSISMTGAMPFLQLLELDANGGSLGAFAAVSGVPFTTNANTRSIRARVYSGSAGADTCTFSNPMLNVGSAALSFEPQRPSYLYLPDVNLRSNVDGSVADQLYTDGQGRPRAVRRFREMVVDGSYWWGANGVAPFTGYKRVGLGALVSNLKSRTQVVLKYDGKILGDGFSLNWSAGDQANLDANGDFAVTITNADSGWGQDYTPSNDEIKAYFYGWKMYTVGDPQSVNSVYNGSGTKGWCRRTDLGGGSLVLPTDTYAGFTPYRLMYQLAQSVDEPISYEGDLMLHDGANQIEVGTGVVVREAVKPTFGSNWDINNKATGSALKNRLAKFVTIFRNEKVDNAWATWTGQEVNGNFAAGIGQSKFDQAAAYSVTYLALDTYALGIAPASIDGEYAPNIKETVDTLTRDMTDARAALSVLQATKAQKQPPQWIAPTLLNGWVLYDAAARPVGYFKDDNGIVRLRGNIKSGSLTTVAIMLPAGYRPNTVLDFGGFSYKAGSIISEIVIDTIGRVIIQGGGTDLISLDGVTFRSEQ
ncbi:hypothetical protein [Cohnella nanjingensis]|nr:hypothetical protein [Cohnella nanjingensis]